MGNKESRSCLESQGQKVEIMKRKYGDASIDCLQIWTNKYGFPEGASLSKKELQELEIKL